VEAGTGAVRFGARDYLPGVGRWASKDMLGMRSNDFNIYSYSFNNPINYTDATGLAGVLAVGVVWGGLEIWGQLAAGALTALWLTEIQRKLRCVDKYLECLKGTDKKEKQLTDNDKKNDSNLCNDGGYRDPSKSDSKDIIKNMREICDDCFSLCNEEARKPFSLFMKIDPWPSHCPLWHEFLFRTNGTLLFWNKISTLPSQLQN
jgi:RHS repeat-associated protein